uniref:Putative ovule protein n=1 Tax=Solanum chacoense TaxID=4108 RepID=A0A0V0GMW0_SOLCH
MMSFTSAISFSICFDLLFLELRSIGNNPCTPKVGKIWYNLPSLDPHFVGLHGVYCCRAICKISFK